MLPSFLRAWAAVGGCFIEQTEDKIIPSSTVFISCLFFSSSRFFGKHFLDLLHSFSETLDHLHYHYPEFFFWKVAYLLFI